MSERKEFEKADFLPIVTEEPISVAEICRRMPCVRNTAKKYLRQLEADGLITRITIQGSKNYAYVRSE